MNYNELKININEYLKDNFKDEILKIYDNNANKQLIKNEIEKYLMQMNYTKDVLNLTTMIYNDLFGLGVIDQILEDSTVTDISFNGHELWIQSNICGRTKYDGKYTKEEAYVITEKIALLSQKSFNVTNPILDVEYELLRINAIHESLSPDGRSFSIRITKVSNNITPDNFPAPDYVKELLIKSIKDKLNVIISGVTGSGKSELQKFLIGNININEKIVVISDNNELKLSKIYPEKDIYSWITKTDKSSSINVDFKDLIKPALRYNPEWIIISESRGYEAFDMINAATTGHNIITTLHANSAYDIPTRLLNMCTENKSLLNEKTILRNIYNVINLGVHMNTKFSESGEIIRYIDHIVEYNVTKTGELIKNEKYKAEN